MLGNRLIHFKHHGDENKWRHKVCENDCREDGRGVLQIAKCSIEGTTYWRPTYKACQPCYVDADTNGPPELWKHRTMHLTLLRVCRHIYREANNILWTTNTYSFNMGSALHKFVKTRTIDQKSLFRNLRLEIYWDVPTKSMDWLEYLGIIAFRSLVGLRKLRLNIVTDLTTSLYHNPDFRKSAMLKDSVLSSGLKYLSATPARDIQIWLRPSGYRSEEGRITRRDEQEICNDLQ